MVCRIVSAQMDAEPGGKYATEMQDGKKPDTDPGGKNAAERDNNQGGR